MALVQVLFRFYVLMWVCSEISADTKRILLGDTDYLDNKLRQMEQMMNSKMQEIETYSKKEIQNLTQTLHAMQETDINSKKQIQNLTQTLHAMLDTETNSKKQIQNLTQTIHVLQHQAQQTQNHVAFYATLSNHVTVGQKQIVEFDKVITNIGNGYNEISGVFTAPVAGLYQFSTTMFQMDNTANKEIHTQMMQTNTPIGQNFGNQYRSSATMNVIVSANKGDIIYMRHHEVVTTSPQTIFGHGYSSFSGFLIA